MKGADGLGSMADHIASAERQLGRKLTVAEGGTAAAEVDPPAGLLYVWGWFVQIARRRQMGPHGPNPLTHSEIESWSRLTGTVLTPAEATLLFRIDDVVITVFQENR